MQLFLKISISLAVILLASFLGKKTPSLAGLLAVMPLTGVLVLVWLNMENRNNTPLLLAYTKGALWGIVPTILFYLSVLLCLSRNMQFSYAVIVSFIVWGAAAAMHQMILK